MPDTPTQRTQPDAAELNTPCPRLEAWLRNEVATTFDRVMADPRGNTLSAEEAHERLQAHMRRLANDAR
jgi:hypothetical protein